MTRDARFQAIILTFRSPNVVTRSLLWISSKLGCLQFPVGALEGTVCAAIALGLTDGGVAGIDMALMLQRLPSEDIVNLG